MAMSTGTLPTMSIKENKMSATENISFRLNAIITRKYTNCRVFFGPLLENKINCEGVCVERSYGRGKGAVLRLEHIGHSAGETRFHGKFEEGVIKIKSKAGVEGKIFLGNIQSGRRGRGIFSCQLKGRRYAPQHIHADVPPALRLVFEWHRNFQQGA